jgi:hypothetical protein
VNVRSATVLPFPGGLTRSVADPKLRHRFERVADVHHQHEWQLRCDSVEQVRRIAARGSRGEDEDWAELVEAYLRRLERDAGLEQ